MRIRGGMGLGAGTWLVWGSGQWPTWDWLVAGSLVVWELWVGCVRGWCWRPVSTAVVWRGAEDGSHSEAPNRSVGKWRSRDSLSLS